MTSTATAQALIARAGGRLVAVPLAHVLEVMRPLPVQALAAMPPAVVGLATIRGNPVPVVDLARLLTGRDGAESARFLTLRAGVHRERVVALAVERIEGIRDFHEARLEALPPLAGAAHADTVQAIGTLDTQLLLVLQSSRILDEKSWDQIDETCGTDLDCSSAGPGPAPEAGRGHDR